MLFAQLAAGLSVDERKVILDLGPARAANIRFFSAYRCRIRIGDVLDSLPRLAANREAWTGSIVRRSTPGTEPPVAGTVDVGVPPDWLVALPRDEEPADIVLAWDGLNYLSLNDFPLWSDHMAAAMRPGALLHAFIATQARLSDRPCRYDIQRPQRCDRLPPPDAGQGASPRYNQTELLRLMPGFEVVRSVLLQDGWQEYLFRRR